MLEEIDNINIIVCKLEKQVQEIYRTKERKETYTQIRFLKQTLARLDRLKNVGDQKSMIE